MILKVHKTVTKTMTNNKDFNYFMKYEYYVVDVEGENKLGGTVQGSTCFPFLLSK